MLPVFVVRPTAMDKCQVAFIFQELATGQPVGIVPHPEPTQGACQPAKFDKLWLETHFRRESESTARIPHRAIAHAHDSPHRS